MSQKLSLLLPKAVLFEAIEIAALLNTAVLAEVEQKKEQYLSMPMDYKTFHQLLIKRYGASFHQGNLFQRHKKERGTEIPGI